MVKIFKYLFLFFVLSVFGGCSHISESTKIVLGTSTKKLEEARVEAISKKFNCGFEDCYEAVLSLARNEKKIEPVSGEKVYDIFMKDWVKSHIVVMGIEGNVNTTEVGIFFSKAGDSSTKVEVSSLSSSAKRKVAEAVFAELDMRFYEAP